MSHGFVLRKIYSTGYCSCRGFWADKRLGWRRYRFHARCFLLEHPRRGLFLVDTGYGSGFLEATRRGGYAFYRKVLPVHHRAEERLVTQLADDGISTRDLSYLILTHFHGDHVGGLKDFAAVPWVYRRDALDDLQRLSPLRALGKGFIKELIPDVSLGSLPIVGRQFDAQWRGFSSMDLFGDGSLHLIDLPGHALGQMGVSWGDTLLAADATWGCRSRPPWPVLLLQEDLRAYWRTFKQLQHLSSSTQIIPTHNLEPDV